MRSLGIRSYRFSIAWPRVLPEGHGSVKPPRPRFLRSPNPVSAAGWQQIYPRGLYDTLTRIRREYGSPETVITENGVPDDAADSGLPTGDHGRVEFLEQHLGALHQAIADGCRVIGYHAWSLFDNFEWAAGYSQRWGLVRVDFDTSSAPLRAPPPGTPSWPRATNSRESSTPVASGPD